MAKKSAPKKEKLILVNFKITEDLFRDLSEYSKSQRDEVGQLLTPPTAARRLMVLGLEAWKKKG